MVFITEGAAKPHARVLGVSACLCAGVLLLIGCGKGTDSTPGKIVGKDVKKIADMAPGEVIVQVGDSRLTRKDFDAYLDNMVKAYRVSHPAAREMDVTYYRKTREHALVSEFITKEVLLQEARRRNLRPDAAELANLEGRLEARAKKEGKTLEQFQRDDPETVAAYRSGASDQALIVALRAAEFGDRLTITDADMQEARDRFNRFNQICERTNALVKARGAAIFERLKKGEDFISVAVDTSEFEEAEPGVWGEFSKEEIDNPAVRNAAFTLPVGGVSEPIDTEEGLVIIKVLERSGFDSPLAVQPSKVKLGRIILRLAELRPVPRDEELRKVLERSRLEALQKEWLKGLQQKVRIEFPHGTNFWATLKNKKEK